jgi:hypothetical protein
MAEAPEILKKKKLYGRFRAVFIDSLSWNRIKKPVNLHYRERKLSIHYLETVKVAEIKNSSSLRMNKLGKKEKKETAKLEKNVWYMEFLN